MVEKLSFVIFRILSVFDFLFFKITKRKFLPFFQNFLENDSYNVIKILNKDINFFVPNSLVKWNSDSTTVISFCNPTLLYREDVESVHR